MMRTPQGGPWKFLIAECKIYTGKWGNDESPQGGPWKSLITKCKIYTEKWRNDENPAMRPPKFLITECKIYTGKWGMMRVRKEVPGNFSSRNVKFTRRNGE